MTRGEVAKTIKHALIAYEEDLQDDEQDWNITAAERETARHQALEILAALGEQEDGPHLADALGQLLAVTP